MRKKCFSVLLFPVSYAKMGKKEDVCNSDCPHCSTEGMFFLPICFGICKKYYDSIKEEKPFMHTIAAILNENGSTVCRVFTSEKVFRRDFFVNHKHTDLELSLILSGRGIYRTKNGAYPIEKGDIFLYGTNEEHCISDADDLSLLNIHMSPRFFWGTDDGGRFLDLYYRRSEAFRNRIPAESEAAKAAIPLFSAIKEEAEEKKEDYTHFIRSLLTEVLILLYRNTDYARQGGNALPLPGAESLQKVCRAADYIDQHYTEDITLAEIAAHVHLTRTYFSALFTASYGISAWEYIHIKRIEYAKKLLRSSDETVLSVALQCGFNNTANFNRAFRQTTGTTPKAYRAEKEKYPL